MNTPDQKPLVAVVGAGMAGAACATRLVQRGVRVVVLDKGRSPGGRMCTRRQPEGTWEHGCRFVSARGPEFLAWLGEACEVGVAAPLAGPVVSLRAGQARPVALGGERFVGVPGNDALVRHLLEAVEVRSSVRVEGVSAEGAGWRLRCGEAEGELYADALVLAIPAPQIPGVLDPAHPFAQRAAGVRTRPCWSVMLSLPARVAAPAELAFVEGSALAWVGREAQRPGRGAGERWVLHATAAWSQEHLEAAPEEVADALVDAFRGDVAPLPAPPEHVRAHRWRYAFVDNPLDEGCLLDRDARLGVCGDWCLQGDVEGAWRSGVLLAERLVGGLAEAGARGSREA